MSYKSRLTFLILSFLFGLILLFVEACNRKLDGINYRVRVQRHQRNALLWWRNKVDYHIWSLLILMFFIDQFFIASLWKSTYSCGFNFMAKVMKAAVCISVNRILGNRVIANILYFYYLILATVITFFCLIYFCIFLLYFFQFSK
jgi:hypothetical protein